MKILVALCACLAAVAVAALIAFGLSWGKNRKQTEELVRLRTDKSALEATVRRLETAAAGYQTELTKTQSEAEEKIARMQMEIKTAEAKIRQLEEAVVAAKAEAAVKTEEKKSAEVAKSAEQQEKIDSLTLKLAELKQSLSSVISKRAARQRQVKQIEGELAMLEKEFSPKARKCYEFCIAQEKTLFRRVMKKEKVKKSRGYFVVNDPRKRLSTVDPQTHLWDKVEVKYVCTFHGEEWTQARADRFKKAFGSAGLLEGREAKLKSALERTRREYSRQNFDRQIAQLNAAIHQTQRELNDALKRGEK